MKKVIILVLALALILSGCMSSKDAGEYGEDAGNSNANNEKSTIIDGEEKMILPEEMDDEKVEEAEETEEAVEAVETIESYCATLEFIEDSVDADVAEKRRVGDMVYFSGLFEEAGSISVPLPITSRIAEYISYPAELISRVRYVNGYSSTNLGRNSDRENAILRMDIIDNGNLKNTLFDFFEKNGWEDSEGDSNQFYYCEGGLKNSSSRVIYNHYDIHELKIISDKYEGKTTKIIEQLAPINNLSDLSDYVNQGYLIPDAIVNSNLAIDHLYEFNIDGSGLVTKFRSSQPLSNDLLSEIYKMSEGKEVIFEKCNPKKHTYELWYAEGNEIVLFSFTQSELESGLASNYIETYRHKADLERFKRFVPDSLKRD